LEDLDEAVVAQLPEGQWRRYIVRRFDRVETQTTETNGRVTDLEADRIKRDAIRKALVVGIPLGAVVVELLRVVSVLG
jgi:tetrahydromethanopterin S-methyltransferase subunit G